MTAFFRPAIVIALASSAIFTAATISAASAAPVANVATVIPSSSNLVKVHDDGRYYRHHRRHYRRYHRDHVVDALFAHVESGRHTVVDAPFVHVYRGRHGKHIVAPFVDLWEPR